MVLIVKIRLLGLLGVGSSCMWELFFLMINSCKFWFSYILKVGPSYNGLSLQISTGIQKIGNHLQIWTEAHLHTLRFDISWCHYNNISSWLSMRSLTCILPKEKGKPWLLFPFPIGSLPANRSKQKGAGSMTGSLTVHWTLECSGVSGSPGKETLIYTTIFGITENK